ncbi:hypothetical protein OSTOST_18251, partial [Ostertagia ostertagi]
MKRDPLLYDRAWRTASENANLFMTVRSVDSYALEQTLEFIKSVMSSGDGAVCADGSSASYHRQPVAAVVGAAGSQVSVMVASMLQLFK